MENRDRDKMSKNTSSTDAGDVNRNTSIKDKKQSDSSADFGEKIGRSESIGNEPSRRPGSSGSSSGSSSSGISSGRGSNSEH